MIAASWIRESLGAESIQKATEESGRRRLYGALNIHGGVQIPDEHVRFVGNALELHVFELLKSDDIETLRAIALEAFQVARAVPPPSNPLAAASELVRLGCLGILGERGADVRRILDAWLPDLPIDSPDWGTRVEATILNIWLLLFRKSGWADLDAILQSVANLRNEQRNLEPDFLAQAERRQDARPAWHLMSQYHLAKAAEILGAYISQGSVDGNYDIREQLEAQFDRAIATANRGKLIEEETRAHLLAQTAKVLVDNSIWTVTRAVNSRVTMFAKSLVSRGYKRPIFEMLPPQRHALREQGLLGSSQRSVVVSLPTSSGKTLIAKFRILQALNQFDHEKGWVAYVAPTRALVNQLTLRLRRDFDPLGITVEKVSPALEVDGHEANMLTEGGANQFRILVTTPEKLDLMLRGVWKEKIKRPLTLVVVDEAHNLASPERGIKLELLLATINRECQYAQFLLLTPFIPNADDIARWLDPNSNKSINMGVNWNPNDRVIAIAHPVKGGNDDFFVKLVPQHTTKNSINFPGDIDTGEKNPLNFSWSDVSQSPNKLAAATAKILQSRGTVIVLVSQLRYSWGVADAFKVEENLIKNSDDDLSHIQRFLADEMGEDFPLASLLKYGVGVHHTGISPDTRTLVEWLAEQGKLKTLVATTTLAQGVNFPVSGVVFASHQYPYGQDMPPEDFWNIAGRAGRVDQDDLGIIALAAQDDNKQQALEKFIGGSVAELNSTLIDMVQQVMESEEPLHLKSLSWQPEWSAFLQYLAHTYRQIGNHEQFAMQVEQVLRGTLGFQALRKSDKGWADTLVQSVHNYAEHLQGKPLQLVDATGFSWESVANTLARLKDAQVTESVWSTDIFGAHRENLRRMMGVLLSVPELQDNLEAVTGGPRPDGDMLSRIICDWVRGRPLTDMAADYFSGDDEKKVDSAEAMTKCCRSVFGKLTQTASWGLSALQSLTLGDAFNEMSDEEERSMRNIPARVYYGVNTDEAIALRLLGVPRNAAQHLVKPLEVTVDKPLHEVRKRLQETKANEWTQAMGERGESYHHVWSIIEGLK